jgi:hypothetical protein
MPQPKHQAADRLLAAEVALRAAQALLQADREDDAVRQRYRMALAEMKAAEQAAQAVLNDWKSGFSFIAAPVTVGSTLDGRRLPSH